MSKSLESELKWFVFGVTFIITCLILWILYLTDASLLIAITVFCVIGIPFAIKILNFYRRITQPFYQLTSMVEAIKLEDYSLRINRLSSKGSNTGYNKGILGYLTSEINSLASVLQNRKQLYDQHAFITYQLMEQLDTPMVVFNEKLQLSHANEAFSLWCKQPWQTLRHYLSTKFGLVLNEHQQWTLESLENQDKWQVRQSQFLQNNQKYHLLVLTNIEEVLRKTQQESWLQIVRVLSHEIHNSLTPIKSLAQSMAEMPTTEQRSRQALEIIVNRSQTLQEFVDRYSTLYRDFNVKPTEFDSEKFFQQFIALFNQQEIRVRNNVRTVFADPVLLEQVIINLLKNAIEACSFLEDEILIFVDEQKDQMKVRIVDKGQGIANPENLFVPFYTTKENGSGIGLALCRNIIEQHGGSLTLSNNDCGEGVTAEIILPVAPKRLQIQS